MLSRQVCNPRRNCLVKLTLQSAIEWDQLPCSARTAGRNQMRDGPARQHPLFPGLDSFNPWRQIGIANDRNILSELLVSFDPAELMSATVSAADIAGDQCHQQTFLNEARLFQRPPEPRSSRQARRKPERVSDGGGPVHQRASCA